MTFIRSDALAAQVLQASLKDANGGSAPAVDTGKAVLPPPPPTAKPEALAASDETTSVGVTLGNDAAGYTSSKLDMMDMRQKVADFSSALDAMKDAVKAMGSMMAMAIESDDASAASYASKMFDQAWNEAFGSEAFGSGPVIEGEAAEVAPVAALASDTVEEELTVEEEFLEALEDLTEMTYDSEISVTAEDVDRIMGSDGDDNIQINATYAERIVGNMGNDNIYIEAQQAFITGGGKGDDTITINAAEVVDVWDGGGDDSVTINGERASMIEIGKGDDVYDLNVGEASVHLREMGGNDTLKLKDGGHLEMYMPTGEMLDEGAAAEWDGDALVMSFASGDSVRLENAANAGSITLRSGETVIKLMEAGVAEGEGGDSSKVLDTVV